jgi:hypothetical protein
MVQGWVYGDMGYGRHFWESATVCRNGVVNPSEEQGDEQTTIAKMLDMLTGGVRILSLTR